LVCADLEGQLSVSEFVVERQIIRTMTL